LRVDVGRNLSMKNCLLRENENNKLTKIQKINYSSLMEMKKLFPQGIKECKIKGPWQIDEISNGLRARSVRLVGGHVISSNKKVPVQYFEYDRIFGRGAFAGQSMLKVMDMFDALKKITPKTIGYLFKDDIYLNYDKGILKRNNSSKSEQFFSEESLRNRPLDDYLQLSCDQNPHEEEDTDRGQVLSESTELQKA